MTAERIIFGRGKWITIDAIDVTIDVEYNTCFRITE
jgi:hypothetical protein